MAPSKLNKQLIYKATEQMRQKQYSIQKDQDNLLKAIKETHEEQPEFSEKNYNEIVQLAENELNNAKLLNEFIKEKEKDLSNTYGIKTNKNYEILNIANEELKSHADKVIKPILNGKNPDKFNNEIPYAKLPVLSEGEFWGTSVPSIYTSILTLTKYALNQNKSDYKFDHVKEYDNSSIIYGFKFPDKFSHNYKSNLFYSPEGNSLYAINSGYSLGGDRLSTNPNKPHDCSSFIESIYNLPKGAVSTYDLYSGYMEINKKPFPVIPSKPDSRDKCIDNQSDKCIDSKSEAYELVKILDARNSENVNITSDYEFEEIQTGDKKRGIVFDLYRVKITQKPFPVIPSKPEFSRDKWINSEAGKLVKLFDAGNFETGDIFSYCEFNETQTRDNSIGIGQNRHAGIYLGKDKGKDEFVALNYSRGIPKKEGFGLTFQSLEGLQSPNMEFFSLSRNATNLDLDNIPVLELEFDSWEDIHDVTRYIDDAILPGQKSELDDIE